jgi:O-antigen/teichoic acid export membrane protein
MTQGQIVLAAKGGGIVFAGRLFAWGSRFVLAVFLVRLLGAEQYGLYTIALTVAALGSIFAVIGLDSAMVRYVAIFNGRADIARLRGSLQIGIGLPAMVGLLFGAAMVLFSDQIATNLFAAPGLAPLLRIAGLLVPAMVLNSLLAATLQGFQKIGFAVLGEQITQPSVRFAILVVFALMGMTAELAVVASTLATLIVTVLLLFFVARQAPFTGITGTAERQTGMLLRFSLPVYFSNLVNALSSNLQVLLLGSMSTIASAGIFTVASQINLVGTIFHSAIVSASMPIFAELHDQGDRSRLAHLYQTTSKWTLTLNLPFFLAVVLFPQALLMIFGSEFTDGSGALVILALGAIVNAGTGTSGAVLDMTGHTGVKFINSTLSVGLGIGLNLLLIPPFGVVGAAIAAFGAVSLVNLLRLAEVLWLVGVGPYNATFAKPLVAGAAAALAAVLIASVLAAQPLLLRAGAGILVLMGGYAGLLLLMGLSDDDRLLLVRAANRMRRVRGGRNTREAPQITEADAAAGAGPQSLP